MSTVEEGANWALAERGAHFDADALNALLVDSTVRRLHAKGLTSAFDADAFIARLPTAAEG
jgi:hypothetical protein